MNTKIKYVKFTPSLVIMMLEQVGFKLPEDAKVLDKMAYDRESGNIVILIESESFPEVTGPHEIGELRQEVPSDV